jgi:predicted dehydrogenase
LQELLEGCGEPLVAYYRINAGYLPSEHWTHDQQQGGGRIIGEGCHFVDFLAFLVGETPQEVFSRCLPNDGRYHDDNAVLTFAFSDGSIGVVSYLANGDRALPKERVEVFCAGKVGILDDFRSLELVSGGRRHVFRSRLRQDKGHRAEWEVFARAIREGGSPPIPYSQLFGVARACFAAMQSMRSGLPVKIE